MAVLFLQESQTLGLPIIPFGCPQIVCVDRWEETKKMKRKRSKYDVVLGCNNTNLSGFLRTWSLLRRKQSQDSDSSKPIQQPQNFTAKPIFHLQQSNELSKVLNIASQSVRTSTKTLRM